ncbi:hypothetical protein RYX56_18830 [Alkalihalophilus lindianensis]|uniref:Cell division protein FtsB n=1 Tax=Alkalihalophilus lindianensis TaxID=1630542 RepID=A0ABU3XF11_9BACI|nr:hypothetical protein [Alkalihalophilus lindianensis]MDV2686428.1 hypothetical protein [Alkalihalophilus lindianensis]
MRKKMFIILLALVILVLVGNWNVDQENADKDAQLGIEERLLIANEEIKDLKQQNAHLKEEKERIEIKLKDVIIELNAEDEIVYQEIY